MKRYDGWGGILEAGETIVWQGRPSNRLRFKLSHVPGFVFGLLFAGFALFWMIMASTAGGFFWMFGLIHFSAGLSIALGPVILDNIKRQNTWYTLTDRRAFIAYDLPVIGRRLKSYPINRDTRLEYRNRDTPDSVFFAEEYRRTKNGSRRIEIGFELIKEAADVYKKMVGIQRGQA